MRRVLDNVLVRLLMYYAAIWGVYTTLLRAFPSLDEAIVRYGGYLVGVKLLGVNPGAYLHEMEKSVEWKDIYSGVLKSISFGVIISWVCCYKGYYTGHGAEGVSRATTEAVVMSSVLILIWDYFLTSVLL